MVGRYLAVGIPMSADGDGKATLEVDVSASVLLASAVCETPFGGCHGSRQICVTSYSHGSITIRVGEI